jgi:hypothetical protein
MNRVLLAFALLSLNFTSLAQSVARPNQGVKAKPMQTAENFGSVSPALDKYAQGVQRETRVLQARSGSVRWHLRAPLSAQPKRTRRPRWRTHAAIVQLLPHTHSQ